VQLGEKVARFNKDKPNVHHDALEFSNGQIVLVTRLCEGQHAIVLQLPAAPRTAEEAEEQRPLGLERHAGRRGRRLVFSQQTAKSLGLEIPPMLRSTPPLPPFRMNGPMLFSSRVTASSVAAACSLPRSQCASGYPRAFLRAC
jgi:hypothetical protein